MRRPPTPVGRSAVVLAAVGLAAGCGPGPRRPVPGQDTFVRIERGECMGECPVYSVTLHGDGLVEFDGRERVPRGLERRRIDPAEVARILDAVERIGAWRCDAGYWTDYPVTVVTVSRAGRTRRIVHDHGDTCTPRELRELEADIDRAGGHPQLVPDAALEAE